MTSRPLAMHRWRVALFLCTLATGAAAGQADLSAWIDQQRTDWQVPGVAVAVVELGQPVRTYASGHCDIEKKSACTADSRFHIGSTTKFFTGLLAAAAAADGKVLLDEPLIHAWPEFRLSDPRWTEVTLRDLLSQRSGLGSIEWPYYWDLSLTRKDYLARLPHVPMAEPFRARWAYSNANFVAAGTYLERKLGAGWEDLVRKKFFGPLQMKRSGFGIAEGTRGYWFSADGAPHAFAPTPVMANGPAGTIVSTARDYASFLEMFLGDGHWRDKEVVSPRAIRGATSLAAASGHDRRFYGGPGGYALGAQISRYRDQLILHHAGGYPGYSAHFAILPDAHLAVAVLCNRNYTIFPEALALGVVDQVMGRSADEGMRAWKAAEEPVAAPPAEDPAAPPTRPWSDFAGRYAHPAWGTFEIAAASDGLRIRFGALDVPLAHYRYDSFSFESMPQWERLRVRFEADFDGKIDAFMLDDAVNAQAMRFEKEQPRP
jgi:CubicO group peptidase (beta-lactamase class C family)